MLARLPLRAFSARVPATPSSLEQLAAQASPDPVVKRNRLSAQQIAQVRAKRLRLIQLEKRRAAASFSKFSQTSLPPAIAAFKQKMAALLPGHSPSQIEKIASQPAHNQIEEAVALRERVKDRLKIIKTQEIKDSYSAEDRSQRPLLVRMEEEALDELYQEAIYEPAVQCHYGLDLEGPPRRDLPDIE